MRRVLILALVLTGGCSLFQPKPPVVTLRFYEEADRSLPESTIRVIDVPGTQQRITVDPHAFVTEKDLTEARLVPVLGGHAIQLSFDLHGANVLSELTTRMRGRYVVVMLDERPIAAILVEKRITDGKFLLEGDLTAEEERTLVNDLNQIAGKKRDFGDTQLRP